MIRIFGPSYRYNGEILTKPEIIYINDHHYDEQNRCFHVEKLLENSACDPQKQLVVIEGLGHDDVLSKYNCLCIPGYQGRVCKQFNDKQIQVDWTQKTKTFNFMINKPRYHRNFLLMLIQHFKLDNYSYSLPWKNNKLLRSDILNITNNPDYLSIMHNNPLANMPSTVDWIFGDEVTLDQGVKNGPYRNPLIYDKLLKTTVFEPSCISLITDPIFFEKETKISEKTIMAFYGGTVPVWVGGWRAADRLQELGFDVFNDIIDHSYQNMPDPLDRCYYAVERNLNLLRDFNRVHAFVQQNQSRFQHNLELCQGNTFIDQVARQIRKFDGQTQEELKKLVNPHDDSIYSSLFGPCISATSPKPIPKL
jgi:hypothetical protein